MSNQAGTFRFEVLARDPSSRARVGRLHTPHGVVETPVFMPVGTAASVKGMTQAMLEELGAQLLLANTYHLYLRPGHETIAALGGLHRFMGWPHPLLTDSGGYQVFSMNTLRTLGEEGVTFRSHLDGSQHFLSPEKAIEIQVALGADLIMALDECLPYPAGHEKARASMELTLRWAQRSQAAFAELTSGAEALGGKAAGTAGLKPRPSQRSRASEPPPSPQAPAWGSRISRKHEPPGSGARSCYAGDDFSSTQDEGARKGIQASGGQRQLLFGIVQGGTHTDLRRQCTQRLVEMDFPGYAVGGLAVGEPPALSYEMAELTASALPEDRPRYLMGVGYPLDIIQAVRRGVDLMDCVLPTRNARNATVFTSEGKFHLRNARFARDPGPIDPRCACPVCRRYSRAYLRHLFNAGEMLAAILATQHNLHFYLELMRRIRQAIPTGRLDQLAAQFKELATETPQ